MFCDQCGEYLFSEFREGVCLECFVLNQRELHDHIIQYDNWNNLTSAQRDATIQRTKL